MTPSLETADEPSAETNDHPRRMPRAARALSLGLLLAAAALAVAASPAAAYHGGSCHSYKGKKYHCEEVEVLSKNVKVVAFHDQVRMSCFHRQTLQDNTNCKDPGASVVAGCAKVWAEAASPKHSADAGGDTDC